MIYYLLNKTLAKIYVRKATNKIHFLHVTHSYIVSVCSVYVMFENCCMEFVWNNIAMNRIEATAKMNTSHLFFSMVIELVRSPYLSSFSISLLFLRPPTFAAISYDFCFVFPSILSLLHLFLSLFLPPPNAQSISFHSLSVVSSIAIFWGFRLHRRHRRHIRIDKLMKHEISMANETNKLENKR